MKTMLLKYASMLAVLALFITTVSANSTCFVTVYQEKLPDSAKKLRKF